MRLVYLAKDDRNQDCIINLDMVSAAIWSAASSGDLIVEFSGDNEKYIRLKGQQARNFWSFLMEEATPITDPTVNKTTPTDYPEPF
jgi:hypothetical protein